MINMNYVTANPIVTQYPFLRGTQIGTINYRSNKLLIEVISCDKDEIVFVEFEGVIGFRVLDERNILEYWPTCSTPNGWIYEIESGGWIHSETIRLKNYDSEFHSAKEYLVGGIDECVSVLSLQAPIIRSPEFINKKW